MVGTDIFLHLWYVSDSKKAPLSRNDMRHNNNPECQKSIFKSEMFINHNFLIKENESFQFCISMTMPNLIYIQICGVTYCILVIFFWAMGPFSLPRKGLRLTFKQFDANCQGYFW